MQTDPARQHRVHPGMRAVEPRARGPHDPIEHRAQMVMTGEPHCGPLQPSGPFHPDLVGPVAADVRHVWIAKQGLERPEPRVLVDQFADERRPAGRCGDHALGGQCACHRTPDRSTVGQPHSLEVRVTRQPRGHGVVQRCVDDSHEARPRSTSTTGSSGWSQAPGTSVGSRPAAAAAATRADHGTSASTWPRAA